MTRRFDPTTGAWVTVAPEPIFHDGYMTCPEGCSSKFTVLRTYTAHYTKEHGDADQ